MRDRQRHARTASRRTSTRSDSARIWRVVGGARVRHRRHQHRLHLDRGRAVRRREGVGHRARGLELRHRRLARAEVPGDGRIGAVIVEQRDYHVYTGQAARARAALRGARGSPIQQEILGGLVGAFTTDDRRALHVHDALALRLASPSARSARARAAGRRALEGLPAPRSSRSCTPSRTGSSCRRSFSPLR